MGPSPTEAEGAVILAGVALLAFVIGFMLGHEAAVADKTNTQEYYRRMNNALLSEAGDAIRDRGFVGSIAGILDEIGAGFRPTEREIRKSVRIYLSRKGAKQ